MYLRVFLFFRLVVQFYFIILFETYEMRDRLEQLIKELLYKGEYLKPTPSLQHHQACKNNYIIILCIS